MKIIESLRRAFCRHRNTKRMSRGDYWKHARQPNRYVLTECADCGQILHGYWMGNIKV